MDTESVRVLIGCGFFMMLLVLRLEANRFGAAEFDEPEGPGTPGAPESPGGPDAGRGGRRGGVWARISWYLIGLALLGALYVVHPAPHDVLSMLVGHWSDVVIFGGIVAGLGLAQAAAFAWFRYGYFRLPPPDAYPGAGLNAVATAVIDEATFRGALLGTLIAIGLPAGWSILVTTIVYILITRAAAPGRHRYLLLLAAFIGITCGWATVESGGLGAAILGHAVTAFAVFVFTGHAGRVPAVGGEPEELVLRQMPPAGWHDVRTSLAASIGAERSEYPDAIGPSGFSSRGQGRAAPAWPRALLTRMRDRGVAMAGRTAGVAGRSAATRPNGANGPTRPTRPTRPNGPTRPAR